jgi:hypothetical protein
MPPDVPVPDPGIGQLTIPSEAAQAWVGTAPGAEGPGRAGRPATPLGCTAACRCEDHTDTSMMTPASANTPAATTCHQCRRLPPSPAVPMMSGSGLPSPSGRKGNISDHPYANSSSGEPANEGQRRRARSFIPSAQRPFSGASPSVAISGMTVPIGGCLRVASDERRSRDVVRPDCVACRLRLRVTAAGQVTSRQTSDTAFLRCVVLDQVGHVRPDSSRRALPSRCTLLASGMSWAEGEKGAEHVRAVYRAGTPGCGAGAR